MEDALSTGQATDDVLPTPQELEAPFRQKYGALEGVGWAPRRRFRFGYYLPADVYESLVGKLIVPGSAWLDVGGGHAIFPENPGLARQLASRCARVVAVDPSENVLANEFVLERVQSTLEEYRPDCAVRPGDDAHGRRARELARGLRRRFGPVGEAGRYGRGVHGQPLVADCRAFVGVAISLASSYQATPLGRRGGGHLPRPLPHEHASRVAPAVRGSRFLRTGVMKLDDLSVFGRFKWLNYLELLLWSTLSASAWVIRKTACWQFFKGSQPARDSCSARESCGHRVCVDRRPEVPFLKDSIMTVGKIIIWLIVGALAGTLAGRLLTFRKEGFGTWINIGLGMLGAVVGGYLFSLFNVDLGLGDLKVTFEDLISAFVGSLLCVGAGG